MFCRQTLLIAANGLLGLVFTIEWEFVPYDWTSFARLQPYTLGGAGTCGDRGGRRPSPSPFKFTMHPSFKMDRDMVVVGAGGHLHDGAVGLEIIHNKRPRCRFVPRYGTSPGSVDAHGTAHRSAMPQSLGPILAAKGNDWTVTAHYNFIKHAPMMTGDSYSTVMGVAIMYALDLPSTGSQ
ncbi:hypothetical protein BKA67DRAFT_662769 [Truncatella angustata]|uniref:Uncharacterized protein n=1 Tax=Truncatella angustata TaxID=152316 RepID=A0A9P8ZU08_9PEZI|nr:uncharacterized protein BKA67DRAFT_662769 [Truncatella angustata]KAH6648033.1 hypothetical protein BKA67DRAFT_662769 [Truncatella angustata]